jgi:hypothetical protein
MSDHVIILGLGVVGLVVSAGGFAILGHQLVIMRREHEVFMREARRDSRRMARTLVRLMTGGNGRRREAT